MKAEKLGYLRARRAALERENAVALGKLVPMDQILPTLIDFHTAIKSRVLRLPSVAPALTGKPVVEIFKILQDRVNEALEYLSNDSPHNPIYAKLIAGIRQRAGDD